MKQLLILMIFYCSLNFASAQNQLKLFDEFWQVFDDHYAFFELRGVNWNAQRTQFRSKINSGTSNDELFKIFCDMIDPLDDGHTSLSGNGQRFNSGHRPSWYSSRMEIQKMIVEKYLNGKSYKASNYIEYGFIDESTGYINIKTMEGYDPASLDDVLKEMKDFKKIIIDVRFNGGGEDQTALALASRFADQKRHAYSKETYYKGTYSEHLDLFISPVGEVNTTAKILVLTSSASASATEMFVMAMKILPHALVIGEATAGIHSDIYFAKLSNGWNLGLSNQIYIMPDGKVYEKVGVPPSRHVDMNAEAFKVGIDSILAEALRLN